MSYAIIRNEKYKRENLKGIYRHNERKNTNYSNKNIDKTRSYLNYSIKSPIYSYEKEFDRIREKYKLKGQIKTVSNIVCEYIITSDKAFFNSIGEEETKRYFETAYKFVCQYKNLGEQYILSAKVHLDEDTPHLHLAFIPVVHTTDKKGNKIDKIACSEFWKAKDSYIQLQNAFHSYMVQNGFDLQRGNSSDRKHLSVKEFKEITNYEKSKKTLKDIKVKLPSVPNIKEFGKFTLKRDERIEEEIIKPKDELIQKLYENNMTLRNQLERQVNIIDRAEKFEMERENILQDKIQLETKYNTMKKKLKVKEQELRNEYNAQIGKMKEEFSNKEKMLQKNFDKKYNDLIKENNYLNKVIITFKKTIKKFIHWISKRFAITEEDNLIRDFEKETHTFMDAEEQIRYEKEKEDVEITL